MAYGERLRVNFSTLGKSILKVRGALFGGGELLKMSVMVAVFVYPELKENPTACIILSCGSNC